jgi:hypothetical protein
MCDEKARELIRIDFQVMDLKKQQGTLEVGSSEYHEIQIKIDELQRLKDIKSEQ